MSDRRGVVRVALPSWILASFAAAVLAHAVIGLLGDAGIGADAYAAHAHGAVAPVTLAALSLAAALLLRSALLAIGRSAAGDPIAALGRRCGEIHPLVPSIAVAVGALTTLLAMEFTEQHGAMGHLVGMREALGGNTLLGLAIVAVVGALVTIVGLRSARVLLDGALAAVRVLCSWIVARERSLARIATVRRERRAAAEGAPEFLARCFGMRAPPLLTLV